MTNRFRNLSPVFCFAVFQPAATVRFCNICSLSKAESAWKPSNRFLQFLPIRTAANPKCSFLQNSRNTPKTGSNSARSAILLFFYSAAEFLLNTIWDVFGLKNLPRCTVFSNSNWPSENLGFCFLAANPKSW